MALIGASVPFGGRSLPEAARQFKFGFGLRQLNCRIVKYAQIGVAGGA